MVSHEGSIIHEQPFGYAQLHEYGDGQYPTSGIVSPTVTNRLSEPVAMEVGTVFDLASVTKVAATTMAVMVLVERGVMTLDDPVSTWIPAFGSPERAAITPRMLLTHTSGLPQWWPTYYHASTPAEVWAWMDTVPLSWTPGEERHYSDLGFMTLGRIVEAISERSLDVFVSEEVHAPLGLTTTEFRRDGEGTTPARPGAIAATSHGNPFERRMVHDPDFGYRITLDPESWNDWRTHTLVGEVNDGNAWHAFEGVAGHAGLFSNAADLGRLLGALLGREPSSENGIVNRETIDLFMSEQLPGQALGWQLPDYAPAGSWGHTGFTGTFVLGVPEQGLGIVLLTNKQNIGVDGDTGYTDVGPLNHAVTRILTGSE